MGKQKSPRKIIREHCVECSAGNHAEVRRCQVWHCKLWPHRFGVPVDTARQRGEVVDRDKFVYIDSGEAPTPKEIAEVEGA